MEFQRNIFIIVKKNKTFRNQVISKVRISNKILKREYKSTMESKNKLTTISIFVFVQAILPIIAIIIYQQSYLLKPELIIAHLFVVFLLNSAITGLGLVFLTRQFIDYKSYTKYLVASLFGILNVILYYTYLFAFSGQHFNSNIFTLEMVLGYLKYLDQLVANFSINPILVYVILLVIPILIFSGILLLTNSIYLLMVSLKKLIQRHHFNSPSKVIKYRIIGFLLFVGFSLGVISAISPKIPYFLFRAKEPIATVFIKNDPFDGKLLKDNNKGIEVRNSYPKNIDFQKKNVIIIVIDALRADHLSLFGYERETTPFLDSLYASGNLRKIDLSFAVVAESYKGINAILRSKIWANLGKNDFSLQHLLKDQGYELNFILSGDHTNFDGLKYSYGDDSDFNTYLDGAITKKYSDPNDDRIIWEGLETISNYNKNPSYFHFHLMSVHNLGLRLNKFKNYTPAANTTFDVENYTNGYDNGVLQADNNIKDIFSSLSEKGYLQNSIVVITGDHGESLGEKGKFGHGRSIYTNQILTPILIYDSENAEYKNTSYASSIDIAPTIVDRLGLPIPQSWEGISLFSDTFDREFTYHQQGTQYAIIHSLEDMRYKLIYDSSTSKKELFELNSDLYETKNLIDSLDTNYINNLIWYMSEFNLDVNKLYK
ncbi:sulfatase-like hydrolase/transferase [uncultured Gelidibacter sp.]|uniref:sulfatase-like hydrolase/transferase n=1 Tax=uncultured Gelidibacter sp. TaxID=259318 RepID=UPI0026129777|nr:sulfatase-like hydrolase/transferase [uncultured Gelidibacter sp.]